MNKKPIAYLPAIRGDNWDPFIDQMVAAVNRYMASSINFLKAEIPQNANTKGLKAEINIGWNSTEWVLTMNLDKRFASNLNDLHQRLLAKLNWSISTKEDGTTTLTIKRERNLSAGQAARNFIEPFKMLGVEPRKEWNL